MEIGTWLRSLGLERYEPAFRENEIDWEALPKLTAEDLKDLGVVLGGHRRRLLDAIAALGDGQPAAAAPPSLAPALEAERRQLTVMFCDLVGSTPLSTRFDPEDLREIVGAYHRCVADTVACFAGFVAKYMGDGVLIYFGYPEAHEDDAERAVRAGLAVIDAIGKLATPERLNVRLGVASGLCRGRRSDRRGRCARARCGRRDPEPRRAAADIGRTGHARHRREHATTNRRIVRGR
jgi:class 3 adenylate cyclase